MLAFKKKEQARPTLTLPVYPSLDAVDDRSIDCIIAFDAPWIEDDTIRVAQSYERETIKGNGGSRLTRVKRTIDEVLAFWMQDVKRDGTQGTSYWPGKIFVNPAA